VDAPSKGNDYSLSSNRAGPRTSLRGNRPDKRKRRLRQPITDCIAKAITNQGYSEDRMFQ
jgi:hypothetical protein